MRSGNSLNTVEQGKQTIRRRESHEPNTQEDNQEQVKLIRTVTREGNRTKGRK